MQSGNINQKMIQDEQVNMNSENNFIHGMHKIFIEIVKIRINCGNGYHTIFMPNMF